MANILNLVSEESFINQTDKIAAYLAAIAAKDSGTLRPTSWAGVQSLVRNGLANEVFAIGDQLTCQRGNDTLVWDIIGIDHDTPADPQFTHSLTLQLHDCFPTILQFDAPEAFYYAENGLAAGTYHFTIDNTYDAAYNDLTSYQFTLTQAVPAGGQLTLLWASNSAASGAKVSSFTSDSSAVAIEQLSLIEGSDGTDLGTLTAAGDFTNNLNSIQRVRFGNNNYKESAIRQWINSDKTAGSVWSAQNSFDRPPSWAANTAGFLNGMDADFLAVIGNTTKVTARNAITDGGSYDTLTDKFFLPSTSEIYMDNETANVNEGEPYRYYSDYSDLSAAGANADSNRIKHRNDVAQIWFSRTPIYNAGSIVRGISETGARIGYNAYGSYGIVPACNII